MMIPDNIRVHKPDTDQYGATEIRCIKNHFYVYEISSKWDTQKNRPKKVTGKCIGKITEKDGFIPNANHFRTYETISPVVRSYGVFEMFEQLGKDISDRLKEAFSDIYREVKTVALLWLVYGCTPRLIREEFDTAPNRERWDGQFVFKGRVIWHHKEPCGNAGNYLYVFRDDAKRAKEEL